VHIPQSQNTSVPSSAKINAYKCTERYGYVWVCLDEPIAEVPTITEAFEPNFRLIHEFYEPWKCAGLRVMENEFDFAHPTFVHTGTFGSEDHPTPELLEINETTSGLKGQAKQIVVNTKLQQQNLKLDTVETYRILDMEWFMPFTIKLRINYFNGLAHIIVNTMTPIDDANSQMVQFCLRNDTEADTPTKDVVAFDRAVTLEDKRILETTTYDVPLIPTFEQNMFTDKPGLLMRKKLMALLKAHGETEQTATGYVPRPVTP